MPEAFFIPSRRTAFAGMVAVAAVAGYFVLFVTLGFLEVVRRTPGGVTYLPVIVALLGGGGIAGSALAARRFDLSHFSHNLGNSFRVCGVAAALGFVAEARWVQLVTALATGLSFGWLAVTLAAGLRATLGTVRLGRYLGVAVGIALALGHVPWLLGTGARGQILLAGAWTVLGALAAPWLAPASESRSASPDYAPRTVWMWVAVFLVLVGLAVVVLYSLRYDPALKAGAASGWSQSGGNAVVSVAAAVVAGWMLDRSWVGRSQVVAFALVAAASVCLGASARMLAVAPVLATAAVAFFATALLHYAARGGRPLVTGNLFAVAGWGGVTLGASLAESVHGMPPAWLAGAAAIVATALGIRTVWRRRALAAAKSSSIPPPAA